MTRPLLVAAVALAAVGAEWDVNPGAGTPIQTAIDGAGDGMRFMCMGGCMPRMWMCGNGLR